MEDEYITINNIKIRYWSAGDHGSAILLIHGFAGCVEFWHNNINELAKHNRVYALDVVGFGRSDKPKVNYTGTYIAKFIKDFILAKNLEKISLVGHSLGGAAALHFAIEYPQLLDKLILVSSAGLSKEVPLRQRILSLPLLGEIILYLANKKLLTKIVRTHAYKKAAISNDFIDQAYAILQLPNAKKSALLVLRQNATFFGAQTQAVEYILNNLPNIKTPTLIIWGRQDTLLPLHQAENAQRMLPNAQLHVFDKCGHFPPMEVSEEFNNLVSRFVGGNKV